MYYVYVLRSLKSSRFYTGYTADLRKRFNQHVTAQGGYTRKKGPYELIYYEACGNDEDAKARELFLKTGMGKRYIRNRLKRFLSLTG
ncbi:MAG: excinuclease ABC subunit C [Candidatus Sungbacteria bacterium RIFCSPHIGHO2_02_FULL_49_12]|uniref:Excinuclease ABC subunit C n=1 Tax=Candidatus Sungbacteria bacterium RIFCSPHIGHO2_02_FULL_49_12 TaxID=1802271 RepID=A0A1G2KMF6_9BACT|nr:MAG: excinuclease ABC subunit C [Candidatus Sungbacteria bacterium RIFCSPHIGHO2_02_FULL_49_12]